MTEAHQSDSSLSTDGSLSHGQKLALDRAFSAALDYRNSIKEKPAKPTLGLDDAVTRFRIPLSEDGMREVEVIEHIISNAEGGLHQMAAPTFIGYAMEEEDVDLLASEMIGAWRWVQHSTA